MTDPAPPEVLTVRWCPKCGQIGGESRLPLNSLHAKRAYGPACEGNPRELTYVLATSTDQPAKKEDA